jgi:hypothetical protein
MALDDVHVAGIQYTSVALTLVIIGTNERARPKPLLHQ